MSFGKQFLNYSRETLKKCWKFGENFWGILVDWLCRNTLNIFMKSPKNFKKLLKNYGVNVKLILGKLWGNTCVILHHKNYKEISEMFLWNFSEIVKKIWINVEITFTTFLIFWLKFCDIFLSVFGKTCEKLLENMKSTLWFLLPSRMQLSLCASWLR